MKTCNCGASLARGNKSGLCADCGKRGKRVPLPEDWAQYAPILGNAELMARYGCGSDLIARWRRDSGIPAKQGGTMIAVMPAPDDFRLIAPTKTVNALTSHYHRSRETIQRWLRETGVQPMAVGASRSARNFNPVNVVKRDMTLAGRAADFLQKKSSIWRCDWNGRHNPSGKFWKRGIHVLNAEQVVEKAFAPTVASVDTESPCQMIGRNTHPS